jgi:hypothetical protein
MDRSQGMPRHAAIYARQSRTTEGSASLSIQVDTCREVAARFGIDVAHELVEPPSTSGYKNRGRDRPQFLRLGIGPSYRWDRALDRWPEGIDHMGEDELQNMPELSTAVPAIEALVPGTGR